jgi:hypothetical protein
MAILDPPENGNIKSKTLEMPQATIVKWWRNARLTIIIIIMITRRRNPTGFLLEVWSPLQAILSTCVGSFTCPGIDAQVQGTTVFSLIRQTLFVLTTYSSMCPGWDRTRSDWT